MIKTYYYSTLNDKMYEDRESAERAEDKYVEDYFKELDLKIAAKKRRMRNIADADEGIRIYKFNL